MAQYFSFNKIFIFMNIIRYAMINHHSLPNIFELGIIFILITCIAKFNFF
jgi:hypothetical protein